MLEAFWPRLPRNLRRRRPALIERRGGGGRRQAPDAGEVFLPCEERKLAGERQGWKTKTRATRRVSSATRRPERHKASTALDTRRVAVGRGAQPHGMSSTAKSKMSHSCPRDVYTARGHTRDIWARRNWPVGHLANPGQLFVRLGGSGRPTDKVKSCECYRALLFWLLRNTVCAGAEWEAMRCEKREPVASGKAQN